MNSQPYSKLSNAPWSFVLLGLSVFRLFWVGVGSPGEELTSNLVLWRLVPGMLVGGPIIALGIWMKAKMKRVARTLRNN